MNYSRLYWSVFLNAFGSWLTFLGVALYINENYGSDQVALVFLIQTLPTIFLARGACQAIPVKYQQKVYVLTQLFLALNCFVLSLFPVLPVFYLHLFLASLLKSVSTPTFSTLLGRWVTKDRINEVSVRVGALQTSTLALAPIAGAWIKVMANIQTLFIIDGISFLVGVILLKKEFGRNSILAEAKMETQFHWRSMMVSNFQIPKGLTVLTRGKLYIWFMFLSVGAFLNAIEFPTFERMGMKEKEIGYALAAWGVGSFLAFAWKLNLDKKLTGLIFTFALVGFFVTPNWVLATIAFAVAGWSSTLFSGTVIGELQSSIPKSENALPVWAFANQVMQFINLVAYAGVAVLFQRIGFVTFASLTIILSILMLGFLILDQIRKDDGPWISL